MNCMKYVSAHQFYKDSTSATSRKLFKFSLIHLPLLMILFLLNKKKWFVFDEDSDNELENNVQNVIT